MNNFIPVNEPLLNGNEKKYILECIDTGWISSEGPFIKEFEDNMAEYVGRKYGIAVSNGTTALETAVQALELEAGTEVILPTFTIISCAQAIIKAGLVPVVVDCDEQTWNMNVELVEQKITSKTRAIMVVHIYGITVDMNPIITIAEKYGLKIIEDAAEVHGQTYYEKQCGSFGDVSIFSFYPNKNITCGEGGMILTDNERIAEKCRFLRNLCFKPERRFEHDEIGNNFRMTNMQAALGVAQLEKIEETIKRKRHIGELYRNFLDDLQGVQQPLFETKYCNNIYWVYGLVIKKEIGYSAAEIMEKLKQKGIGTRPFFFPMHKQPILRKMGYFQEENCPVAEYISEYGFYLPSGLGNTDEQIKRVSEQVNIIFQEIYRGN